MRALLLFQLIVLVISQQYYDRRYDYFDVDTLIQNTRLLSKYLSCFIDRGPCTPIGRVFKRILPEVIRSRCAKCSPPQKRFVRKAFDAFKNYLPEDYQTLRMKIDPQNKHFDAFEKAIAAY